MNRLKKYRYRFNKIFKNNLIKIYKFKPMKTNNKIIKN